MILLMRITKFIIVFIQIAIALIVPSFFYDITVDGVPHFSILCFIIILLLFWFLLCISIAVRLNRRLDDMAWAIVIGSDDEEVEGDSP